MRHQHPGAFYVLSALAVVAFFLTGWVVGRQSADLHPAPPVNHSRGYIGKDGFPHGACDPDDGTPCGTTSPSLGIAPALGPVKCTEDMSCWCASHTCQPANVPGWVSCGLIHSDALWSVCYSNINDHHAVWRYVGSYDRHHHVWVITGPTSVYLNRSGWAESS